MYLFWGMLRLFLLLLMMMLLLLLVIGVYEAEDVRFAESDDVSVLKHRSLKNAAMIGHKSLGFGRARSHCHDTVWMEEGVG